MMTHQEAVEQKSCPACGAAQGELCQRPGGQRYHRRFYTHAARRDEDRDDDESDDVWLTIAIVVPLLALWLWLTRLP